MWYLIGPVVQGLVTVLMLPVTTRVLDTKDFGIYALLTTVVGFGHMAATVASGYTLSEMYLKSSVDDRKRWISACMSVAIGIALVYSLVVLFGWFLFLQNSSMLGAVPDAAIYVSATICVIGVPWLIMTDVLTLERQPKSYTAVVCLQALATAIAVIVCLYIFELHVMSLFIGMAASVCVGLAASGYHLSAKVCAPLGKHVIKVIRIMPATMLGGIIDNLQILIERYLLSIHAGLSALGLYSHAQLYRNMMGLGVTAVARSIWPTSLEEAKHHDLMFYRTRLLWSIVYLIIIVMTVAAVFYGKQVIALLTHGKFVEAHPYVVAFMALLLVQHSGKPHTAYLLAHGQSRRYSVLLMLSAFLGICVMAIVIPFYGLNGALTAFVVQQVAFRLLVQLSVRDFIERKHYDILVVLGIATAGFVWLIYNNGMSDNAQLFVILTMAVFVFVYAVRSAGQWKSIEAMERAGNA